MVLTQGPGVLLHNRISPCEGDLGSMTVHQRESRFPSRPMGTSKIAGPQRPVRKRKAGTLDEIEGAMLMWDPFSLQAVPAGWPNPRLQGHAVR